MTAPNHRDLLEQLDREHDRIHSENEWLRADEGEHSFAVRSRREFRGMIPGNSVLALLPASADPLAGSDPSRREEFVRRLTETAGRALHPANPAPVPEPPPAPSEAFVQSVCTGCQGSCCRSGSDHAYLTEETIARVLQDHPEWTLAQILESYVARLPAESIVDSCIYHSATGCGLPRELRSDTCNRYLCGKLRTLRDGRAESPAVPVFAVFFDRGRWARTALVDESGCRVLSDSAQE